jgi:hypothetical protein
MNDVDIYKQETIRAFDELFKSCSEHENNATEEDLPKLLTFGFGVYVAACSIMGEEYQVNQSTSWQQLYVLHNLRWGVLLKTVPTLSSSQAMPI